MNYSVGKFAKKIGVSVNTLQRWDREGILIAHRSPTNQRFYTEEDLDNYFNRNKIKAGKKTVAYCRVSSSSRKSNLEHQEQFIQEYLNANGVILDKIYKDIASGLNYKRPEWNKLLEEVKSNKIDKLYITYKDRFVRYGFEWFEDLCKEHNTEIIILNNKHTSPEEELIEDLFSIIHVFSSRSYGLRSYKKKLQETLDEKEKTL